MKWLIQIADQRIQLSRPARRSGRHGRDGGIERPVFNLQQAAAQNLMRQHIVVVNIAFDRSGQLPADGKGRFIENCQIHVHFMFHQEIPNGGGGHPEGVLLGVAVNTA